MIFNKNIIHFHPKKIPGKDFSPLFNIAFFSYFQHHVDLSSNISEPCSHTSCAKQREREEDYIIDDTFTADLTLAVFKSINK